MMLGDRPPAGRVTINGPADPVVETLSQHVVGRTRGPDPAWARRRRSPVGSDTSSAGNRDPPLLAGLKLVGV